MAAERNTRLPGSFRALGGRLLREAFPGLDDDAVRGYLGRAEVRIAAVTGAEPLVLIVDDEPDLRDIMRRMLERRGFRTLVAADADEALRFGQAHPGVDFVVTDLGVPGVRGRDFARAFDGARMVFISGLPRDLAVADRLIGPDDLLIKKPFTTEELVAALRVAAGLPS